MVLSCSTHQWTRLFERLRDLYPQVPVGGSDGAQDEFSTYLHLLVNWLELEATVQFFGRDVADRHVRALPFYRWVYAKVTEDNALLWALYREFGLLPIRHATDMSPEDLKLAALGTETATPSGAI
jgi:hypothetical protein